MKHLATMNIVTEICADSYGATPISRALTEPRFRDGVTYTSVLTLKCLIELELPS